jgi:hypothetical protein
MIPLFGSFVTPCLTLLNHPLLYANPTCHAVANL